MKNLILMLTLLSTPAFAGEIVGNGGDVIACPDKAPVLLDFFEAGAVHGLARRADLTGATPQEIAKATLRDLKRLNPTRARIYERRIDKFEEEASFVAGAELADIPDSHPIVLPNGCKLRQIAIQKPRMLPQDPLYVIDLDLWNALDMAQKAGLIVHEVIYTDAIQYGHTNSRSVRYLNALLHSNRLEKTTGPDFQDFLSTKMRFSTVVEVGIGPYVSMQLLDNPSASWVEGRTDDKLQRNTCAFAGLKPVTYQEVQGSLKKIAMAVNTLIKGDLTEGFGYVFALYSTSAKKVIGYFANKTELYEEDDASRSVWTICKP
jgi:hypothetical protein